MEMDDYKQVIFRGRKYRRVPEIGEGDGRALGPGCRMCAAITNRDVCEQMRETARKHFGTDCSDSFGPMGIFLDEVEWQNYVVAVVTRRISE